MAVVWRADLVQGKDRLEMWARKNRFWLDVGKGVRPRVSVKQADNKGESTGLSKQEEVWVFSRSLALLTADRA